tara:strand:- start:598 stop:876 length:279 start_codon:yes stop_codon:yes gene_type:complete
MTEAKNIKVRNIITIKRESGLGILKIFFTWLHKVQIIFEITREQIIKRKKPLRLQKIRKNNPVTKILKRSGLFNLYILSYFFSEYPNPFDFA